MVTMTRATEVVGEGDGTVQVCAVLASSSGSRTLECNLTASFGLSNGTKGGICVAKLVDDKHFLQAQGKHAADKCNSLGCGQSLHQGTSAAA